MKPSGIPAPAVMPVDRAAWVKELHLSNFVNAYYQFRDLQLLSGCNSVLMVGPGQGLGIPVLKWRGYQVVTLDIDETFRPDYVGSVHHMPMFSDQQFDAVIVSHVVEHLAEPYLDVCLREIARVGRYALIYLPVHGRQMHLCFTAGVRNIKFCITREWFNYFERPDGLSPRYMSGQHFWELGLRGFRVKDLTKRMEKFFEIVSVYRNHEWLSSHNFVLRSTYASSSKANAG